MVYHVSGILVSFPKSDLIIRRMTDEDDTNQYGQTLSIDTLTSIVCKKEMHGRYLRIGGLGRASSSYLS